MTALFWLLAIVIIAYIICLLAGAFGCDICVVRPYKRPRR